MNAPWSTIPDLVDDAALRFGDREAIVDGDLRWTFAEYRDQIHAASRALMAHGIGAGDRIAVWAPNVAEWRWLPWVPTAREPCLSPSTLAFGAGKQPSSWIAPWLVSCSPSLTFWTLTTWRCSPTSAGEPSWTR